MSKCNSDRWIGAAIVPTMGADEYAFAELKNDVICSGFTEVLVRSDHEPAITVRLAKQRVGRERCERCERCRDNEIDLPRQTLWTRVPMRTSSHDLACEVLRGDGEPGAEEVRMARHPLSCARDASSQEPAAFC